MKLNDIFTEPYFEQDKDGNQIEHNDYTSYAQWANENGYIIQELDTVDSDGHRQFKICAPKEKTLSELKSDKLAELTSITSKFTVNDCGEMHITSSLGYTINADKTAQDNIRGLIEAHGESDIIKYKIYDNSFKEVTIADLKIMLKECAKNGENLYTQKFLYQEKIKACKTIKELEKITFDFVMLDFSKE